MVFLGLSLLFTTPSPPLYELGVELSDRPSAYIDLGPWTRAFTKIDGSGPAKTDASGWPTEDGETVLMDDRAVPAWAPPIDDSAKYQPKESGAYTLSFKGRADVTVGGGSSATIAGLRFSASTGETSMTVTLPEGAPNLIVLRFSHTKRADGGGGLTNLHFYRPGYGVENASEIFTKDFYTAIQPFSYLRFMGWLDTNYAAGYYGDPGHHLLNWDGRTLPGQIVDRPGNPIHGLPWEYVILLANRTHKDVWINIPIGATGASPDDENSYVAQLAKLMECGAATGGKGLDPSLHIYIEHSNEVWNYGFSQYIWNKLAAVDEAGRPGSVLNKDGSKDQEQWARRRHALRLYQIAKIFERAFGSGSLNTRIRPVLAGWTIQPDWTRETLGWMDKNFGPPKDYFYGVAETLYFNDQKAAKTASPKEVLDAMVQDSDDGVGFTQKWKAIADEYGLKLTSYEGGPDNGGGNTANIGNRILANRLPEMKDAILHDFWNNFFAIGGDMASFFSLSSAYSRYGSWGATDDLANLNTPKYEACLELVKRLQSRKKPVN